MDERGTSMTDAGMIITIIIIYYLFIYFFIFIGPVVRIKQGLTKLKNDCSQMEVQIGLVCMYSLIN